MAYSDAKSLREQSASIAGVAIIHAGMGALVVLGLAAAVVIDEDTGHVFTPVLFPDELPPPPPPTPDAKKPDEPVTNLPKAKAAPLPPITVPPSTVLPPSGPAIGAVGTEILPLGGDDIGEIPIIGGGGIVEPTPSPTPTFAYDPVSATPRGAPSDWITQRDYRSSWIRREMTGVASFSLGVGTNGRVTECSVTRSTGHDALDAATCKLISKRARFNPAKDRNGDIVTGSYSSSVRWQLPE
ncbi:MAG: TonB family protein [Marinomonas sp.]